VIEPYEITSHAGVITLYKNNRGWSRHRTVQVKAGFKTRKLDFPFDQHVLRINGLPEDETCWLTIRHGDPLKRMLGRPRHLEVVAKPRRLQAVISGSGACGLHSLATFLRGLVYQEGRPAIVRHQTLWEHLLPAIEDDDQSFVRDVVTGLTHDIESADYLSIFPQCVVADKIVHLIRDGRQVVRAGLARGWFQSHQIWSRYRPAFGDDPFTQCCHFWAFSVRNMESISDTVYRLEDLVQSREAIDALLAYLGISTTERPFPGTVAIDTTAESKPWKPARAAVFGDICGELMDKYYPGWRQS
jgi:hypothetical protein